MIKKLLIMTLLLLGGVFASTARTIQIHGTITYKGSGDAAVGVTIFDAGANKLLGMTGDEGRYSITADSETELIFSGMSCMEQREPVNGRQIIDLEVLPSANQLAEVVVMAKAGGSAALVTEPADLDVEGNYLKLRTKVRIPKKLFGSSKRFIIQPLILNVTRNQVSYLTPLVIDGERYAITQRRMYDRQGHTDSLFVHEQIRHIGSDGDDGTIFIRDSLFVENPKEDFLGAVLSSLENYNSIIYCDTLEIARGTVNPLRFLQMNLKPMTMDEDKFKPVEEVELRDADGQVNFMFQVGKSNLDLELGDNASELEKMLSELRVIESDPTMTLKSFSIIGYASPEGREASNRELARKRMQSTLDAVLQSVDPSLTRNATVSSEADIAPWEDVVTMLRADSLYGEADRLQEILDRYTTLDARFAAISRLPFYSKVIKGYLPRQRRVSYHIVSSCYRPLTDAEIAELYASNPNTLSRYQFYRYYTTKQGAEREEAIRTALAAHPDFYVAATDLSAIMLERGENPMNELKRFFGPRAKRRDLPVSTSYNMAVACLDSTQYQRADSLLEKVPDMEPTHKAKVYSAALNGRYREVMQEVCDDSPLNEVLILLAMKDNRSAARSMEKLGDSAVEEYVKAVVINRLDDDLRYMEAVAHLQNAFRLDPSLINVAKVDSDVLDLLDEEDFKNPEDSDE